jgi:SAM-dependent methyltransferase
MDVNAAEFPPGPYDLIVNFSAAHHIQRVDRVFRALRDLIHPGGLFINYDYVGPHRNQYGWPSWEAAHSVNQTLPAEARQELRYPHLPTMLADDPSEAIHAEIVLETMGRYFEIDEFTPLGGAIGYLLLTHNAGIFGASEAHQSQWAATIMAADDEYLAAHPEDTLFAYWVARPRRVPVTEDAELARWAAEEEARESAAARAGGQYYPHTSLQRLTLELSDQAILAEHRTAWAHDLQAEVESLRAQLDQLRSAGPSRTEAVAMIARLKAEARRMSHELRRRLQTVRSRNTH